MKNIYQHNIELEPIRINNADKATFSQKLIDLPYRGYEVEELSDGRKIVITKPGGKSVYGRPKKEDFLVFIYNPNDNTLWQISHKQILEDVINKEQPHILILESIQDPGNLGTMIRTGEGAGISGIIMNKTTVDIFNPKTVRATMGSLYRVPFFIAEDLTEAIAKLKENGIRLYAAHLKGKMSYDKPDYTNPCGFLIGNEGNGLSDEIADLADNYIKIPMAGKVESLNAAISATLLMYECSRQRRRGHEDLV